jgi:hypothetical protein
MIPPVNFTRAFQQTGKHTRQLEGLRGRDLLSLTRIPKDVESFAVVLIVNADPRKPNRWLQVTAEHKTIVDPKIEPRFVHFEAKAAGMLAARLRPDSEVRLTFQVQTDSPDYRSTAEAERGMIRRRLVVASAAEIDGQRKEEQVPIDIAISDAIAMIPYEGYAALDLGNTSSTLVRRSRALQASPEIHLVQTREAPRGPAEPATSALRIRLLRPPATQGNYKVCDCLIGEDALAGDPPVDSLFLGAKRLLSDQTGPEAPETVDFLLDGKREVLGRTEPAELFVARMLQAFYRQERSYPARLVLTCPTTFSRHEVEQLRGAVYHGTRRSRGLEPRPVRPADEELRRSLPWVIDEASAAAFYFVHDEFLEKAGRIAGFRYIYPGGMNLLLYDCGGGTTDIALVHVEATGENEVRFEVLGRAGHRNFGGDAMTIAVYRLLKVKLAAVLDGANAHEWPAPGDTKAYRSFLTDPAKVRKVDTILPTAFHAEEDDPSQPDIRDRKQATLVLWQAAEAFKRKLADAAGQKEARGKAEVNLADAKALPLVPFKVLMRRARLAETEDTKVLAEANKITLSTDEVDALIEPDARESVRYARCLIESRLPRGQEVHWVYVVGNASRWPLIRRMILHPEHGLPIRFLEERLRPVTEADLKNSVAKGALRVMQVRERFEDYWVEFDEKLMERLPFDIQRKGAAPLEKVLFKENVLYDELPKRDIVIDPPRAGQAAAEEIVLNRVWPGDTKGEEYLRFRIRDVAHPLQGSYRIEYDRHSHRFKMRKLDEDGEGVGETIQGVTQEIKFRNAPVQAGERAWPRIQP